MRPSEGNPRRLGLGPGQGIAGSFLGDWGQPDLGKLRGWAIGVSELAHSRVQCGEVVPCPQLWALAPAIQHDEDSGC